MPATPLSSGRPAPPPFRRLRAYAFDPSLSMQIDTAVLNRATLKVKWEETSEGPVGEYIEVVDYDPASNCFYAPVDLNDPHVLAQDGLTPSEGTPQFHQQMVYAVIMTTIGHFERALGRKASWAPRTMRAAGKVVGEQFVPRLRVYPHALREANAYYSPEKKALLFGYFPSDLADASGNIPGGMVFTCLSHDIVAHETTHALLDGLHRRFIEASNPDVLAFHEAFADIVALFQHFTYPEALRHQIAKTRGDLAAQNMLGQLALQFGQAIGNHGALRNALGRVNEKGVWEPEVPDPSALERVVEPHARGAILVAAVFEGFLSIYKNRIGDLLRIATGGSGILPQGELHPDLVNRLAAEASKSAQHVLLICIRALDYCPPVDVTFGDYLRALITADSDLVPDDDRHYRLSIIEAFRRRGIYPRDVRTLSEDSLRWQAPSGEDQALLQRILPTTSQLGGVSLEWKLTGDASKIFDINRENGRTVHRWVSKVQRWARKEGLDIAKVGALLGLDLRNANPVIEVHSVRPARRVGPDGQHLVDLIVEITQRRNGYLAEELQKREDALPQASSGKRKSEKVPHPADFQFRGGCTLVITLETGQIRYAIVKDILSEDRLRREREYTGGSQTLYATYFSDASGRVAEPFALLHRSTDEMLAERTS